MASDRSNHNSKVTMQLAPSSRRRKKMAKGASEESCVAASPFPLDAAPLPFPPQAFSFLNAARDQE